MDKNFIISILSSADKERIKPALKEVEEQTKKEGLADVLELVLHELINNAVKANLKRVFFDRNGYSFENQESYENGLKEFRLNFSSFNLDEYGEELKMLQLQVRLEVSLDHKRLLVFVENNRAASAAEESSIRDRLKTAMEIPKSDEALMDFYVHYGDETEEKGIGLTMVVKLIQEAGFDPANFRVYVKARTTVARLEFPLSSNYVPLRGTRGRESRRP